MPFPTDDEEWLEASGIPTVERALQQITNCPCVLDADDEDNLCDDCRRAIREMRKLNG